MTQIITHRGTVKSIEGKHVRVRILQASACATCEAKKLCSSSESKEKWIDVVTPDAAEYKIDEEVMLVGTWRSSFWAVVLAYVIPLLVLLTVLFLSIHFTHSEPLSALMALLSVMVYYFVLFLLKFKLSRKFLFSIKHLNL